MSNSVLAQNLLRSYDVTAQAVDASVGVRPDKYRIYNFGPEIWKIKPKESMFLSLVSKYRKDPVDDVVFRYIEDRNAACWTNRAFVMAAGVNGGSAVVAGTSYTFSVADAATPAASIDWLSKGMVFAVETLDTTAGFAQVQVRIDSDPIDIGTSTTFTGTILDLSASISGYNIIADDDVCQVIGSAFDEDEGAPDSFVGVQDDGFGYLQVFKTSLEMSEITMATRFKGYPEGAWNYHFGIKMAEHKADIHRSIIFGSKARNTTADGKTVQTTDGVIGFILKNQTPTAGTTALTYSSGDPYYKTIAQSELTYDQLLADFEVIFDPAQGSDNDRLGIASAQVMTFFNEMGANGFVGISTNGTENRITQPVPQKSLVGPKVLTVETYNGTMHLAKDSLLRGMYKNFLCLVDTANVSYRPLVGNGLNLDTRVREHIETPGVTARKDVIETVAGLQINLPESLLLYNVEGL